MILYCGGIEIKVGDKVDADGYVAKVEAIVESDVQQKDWGVEEPGIMLKGEAFDRMFWPCNSSDWESLLLLSRGT